MKHRLTEYEPKKSLKKYIDSYWFFRNDCEENTFFPVVPDGCSDLIFNLKNPYSENTIITGIMEFAKLSPILEKIELFGIRFKPGMLSYFLETDMSTFKNDTLELQKVNKTLSEQLIINPSETDKEIITSFDLTLSELLPKMSIKDSFTILIAHIDNDLDISIGELSIKTELSVKGIERLFNKRVGLTPKKYIRIMRFQKAHREISKNGLANLVTVALSSGYFDQPHFNKEYKKLVGFNPNSDTMSILYNK